MTNSIKENFTQKSIWIRGLYMLLYSLFYGVAEVVLVAVVVFQFVLTLFTGAPNARALKLGQSISTYIYQIIQYLTFNSDYQAYPFGAWPKGELPALKSQHENS
ncbi:MAG: DUF4389 domain-containing protein [Gammaproteobacteria bacterium]|nr:DUF4389 domain-containing protein [Gammaproteobacteria bacterium]MDH5389388.1 DUF4389 domain-containing protein [Gammaproteobacteria bacterium]